MFFKVATELALSLSDLFFFYYLRLVIFSYLYKKYQNTHKDVIVYWNTLRINSFSFLQYCYY